MITLFLACSPPGDGLLTLTDANNYSYEATMEADTIVLPSYQDARVDWSALSLDLQQRPVDPMAIDRISMVRLRLTAEEVLASVAQSNLQQSSVMDYRILDELAGLDSVMFSDLSIFGNAFKPEDDFAEAEEGVTWILSLWDLERDGRDDILTSLILLPTAGATPTDVVYTNDSSRFTMLPDLQGPTPLETSARATPWTLDWASLTVAGNGEDFDELEADRLVILHFEEDLEAIEQDFVALASNDARAWRADIYGLTEFNLEEALDADGAPFPGFDREGTWLVGLECTSCTNPVPMALSWVDVRR